MGKQLANQTRSDYIYNVNRLYSLLIFLLFFTSIHSQELNQVDSLGRRHGWWVWYYKSGVIKAKGYFNHGWYDSAYTRYSRKGYIKEINYFNNGVYLGYKTFYTSKNKRGKVKRVNGQKVDNTVSKYMYDVDSSLIPCNTVISAVCWNQFDSLGNKTGLWYESVVNFDMRRLDAERYYCKGHYINGVKSGYWYYYLYNGKQLKYLCNYKNDQFEGQFIEFNHKGDTAKIYNYLNDKKNGEYLAFYNNGMLKIKATYKDNSYTGEYFEHTKKGKLKRYIPDAAKQHPGY